MTECPLECALSVVQLRMVVNRAGDSWGTLLVSLESVCPVSQLHSVRRALPTRAARDLSLQALGHCATANWQALHGWQGHVGPDL